MKREGRDVYFDSSAKTQTPHRRTASRRHLPLSVRLQASRREI